MEAETELDKFAKGQERDCQCGWTLSVYVIFTSKTALVKLREQDRGLILMR